MSGLSSWHWQPVRSTGIWRHGPLWLKSLSVVSPWMTIVICLMMMYFLGTTLTLSEGVLFDLPEGDGVDDGSAGRMVSVIMPLKNVSTVFFDDARYQLGNGISCDLLHKHIRERIGDAEEGSTMLVLVDRRIPTGDLSSFANLARKGGVKRLFFANRRPDDFTR